MFGEQKLNSNQCGERMSYNFDINIIDCSAFPELADELSNVYSSPQEKVNAAGMRVVEQFIENLKRQDRLIPVRTILPFHRGVDSLGTWTALAEVYTDFMPLLPAIERQAYNTIYLPLIGPWAEDGRDETRVNDVSDDTGYLAKHGIQWVLGPERCAKVATLLRTHSFSRLIHLVFTAASGLPKLRPSAFFTERLLDTTDVQSCETHAELSALCDAWRIMFEQARTRKWGLWIMGRE